MNRSWFAVYDKASPTPNHLSTTNLNTFFGANVFDPHVTLDYFTKRFAIIATDGRNIRVGVSSTTNANGGWCTWSFGGLNSDNSNGLADFPLVSFEGPRGYMYISVVQFNAAREFVGNRMIIVSTDNLLRCVATGVLYYANLTYPGTATRIPVITPSTNTYGDNVVGYSHWVASRPGGGQDITYFKFQESNRTLSYWRLPSQAYGAPPPARQLGVSNTIDTLDSRIYQATFDITYGIIEEHLSFALPTACAFGPTPLVSCVAWFQIRPYEAGGPRIARQSVFGFGSGYWTFYPTVAMDMVYNLVFNFAYSGTTYHPGAGSTSYSIRLNKYGPSYAQGYGNYTYATGNPARWGDYSAIFPDPAGRVPGQTFWLTGETTIAADRWGTNISAAYTVG